MPKIANHCIRGLDYDLYQAARQLSVKQHITIGELINQAIMLYIGGINKEEVTNVRTNENQNTSS